MAAGREAAERRGAVAEAGVVARRAARMKQAAAGRQDSVARWLKRMSIGYDKGAGLDLGETPREGGMYGKVVTVAPRKGRMVLEARQVRRGGLSRSRFLWDSGHSLQ